MKDIRNYSVYPSNLDIQVSFKKLEDFLISSSFVEQPGYCDNSGYNITLSNTRKLIIRDYAEFISVLKEYPHSLPIEIHCHFKGSNKVNITCIIDIKFSGAMVVIESEDVHIISSFHEKIKEIFRLTNPIDYVKKVSKYDLKKSIFLAHRFDETGNKYSSILKSFLIRLGFQVEEGSGYEGRDIPDKVLDKIKSQDIFICLVTSGDHSWILSEASTAKALNKYLIIICQDKTEFNKGILGKDFEYLSFPDGFIEKTFIDLLYTLPK